ncbi:MAG TPA: glycosyltransferase, partial [Firmicutes bacterium]|nr:glycosyltransferase [Bacillota bacterium]
MITEFPLLLIVWSAMVSMGCLYWIIAGLLDYRLSRQVRPLDTVHPPEPDNWPKVSIIIPACNEADTIENALESKLESDYPDFELIIINDRST